jgi:hypothetical protein
MAIDPKLKLLAEKIGKASELSIIDRISIPGTARKVRDMQIYYILLDEVELKDK